MKTKKKLTKQSKYDKKYDTNDKLIVLNYTYFYLWKNTNLLPVLAF